MLSNTFLNHFIDLKDPRIENHNRRHNLADILVITILGTICGADNWVDICELAEIKYDWLKTFLELPNGIPSHDTFGRIFSLLNPETFTKCFMNWIASLSIDVSKEIIAIDGKTLRGSHDKKNGQKALHLVSAWATQNRLMLGQVKTEEHSNEIEAIPRLLNMLDIKDAIITIDAIGCQTAISKQIIQQGGQYVLSLKENQEGLYRDVASIFTIGEERIFKKMLNRRTVDKNRGHGRNEWRRYTLISARDSLPFKLRWPGLNSIGMVETKRRVKDPNNPKDSNKALVTTYTRYFLTSLHYEQIDDFMKATRQHWHIEIDLHWSLDVSFHEDLNRTRIGNAAENLAIVRRISLNLLKQDTSRKVGIACKRKCAGWSNAYLLKLLAGGDKIKNNENLNNLC